MSDKDKLAQRNILDKALKESFKKMLDLKKKLGQPIVTSDKNGNPIVISAEEAEKLVCNE
ncbi:MAG: hypothetical protein K2M05_00455 [Paramuribaculum sp.]|nr:hypothetical protein [Paramuribaculum sp.]